MYALAYFVAEYPRVSAHWHDNWRGEPTEYDIYSQFAT